MCPPSPGGTANRSTPRPVGIGETIGARGWMNARDRHPAKHVNVKSERGNDHRTCRRCPDNERQTRSQKVTDRRRDGHIKQKNRGSTQGDSIPRFPVKPSETDAHQSWEEGPVSKWDNVPYGGNAHCSGRQDKSANSSGNRSPGSVKPSQTTWPSGQVSE